jgi:hypothetical protein
LLRIKKVRYSLQLFSLYIYRPSLLRLFFAIFQCLKIFFDRFLHPNLPYNAGILRQRPLYLEELLANV